jgi:hypothetical protein
MNKIEKNWDSKLKKGGHSSFDVLFGSFDLIFEAVLHPSSGNIGGSVYRRPSPKREDEDEEEEGGGISNNAAKTGVVSTVVLPGRYLRPNEMGARRLALAETIEERMLRAHRLREVCGSKECPGATAKQKMRAQVMLELRAVDGSSVDGAGDGAGDGASDASAVPVGSFTLLRQIVGVANNDSVTGIRKQVSGVQVYSVLSITLGILFDIYTILALFE